MSRKMKKSIEEREEGSGRGKERDGGKSEEEEKESKDSYKTQSRAFHLMAALCVLFFLTEGSLSV